VTCYGRVFGFIVCMWANCVVSLQLIVSAGTYCVFATNRFVSLSAVNHWVVSLQLIVLSVYLCAVKYCVVVFATNGSDFVRSDILLFLCDISSTVLFRCDLLLTCLQKAHCVHCNIR